jgi:hypothetical protein
MRPALGDLGHSARPAHPSSGSPNGPELANQDPGLVSRGNHYLWRVALKAEPRIFDGEELDWSAAPALAAGGGSDSAIDQKYVAGEVRIVSEQARYPLSSLPQLIAGGNYNLNPEFQRRHRWSRDKQSRLIESFIMNVPVPPIFLYENEYSHYEVMDGLQRLTAIADFYGDRLELTELEEWPELSGRTYSTLPEQVRRGIDRRYLSSIILLYETARDEAEAERLKQLVFERINSGGEDLAKQETRNALYPGAMNSLCIRLARNPNFCLMWGIPAPTAEEQIGDPAWQPAADLMTNSYFQQMEDAELVLRFFAHRQRKRLWRSGTRLDQYLTRYLKSANRFSPHVLDELDWVFSETTALVYEVLGQRAFWLYRDRAGGKVWVERPVLIAYDSVMYAFSALLDRATDLRGAAATIQGNLEGFYVENYELFDGRKTNASDIAARDEAFTDFLASQI